MLREGNICHAPVSALIVMGIEETTHERGEAAVRYAPEEERFWAKVNKDGPLWHGTACWVWTAYRNSDGYGNFLTHNRQTVKAHRWAFEQMRGPIPEELEIDHLCRNRACVNPAHLEPVIHQVNMIRGMHRLRGRTHCANGHPFDEGNTYHHPSGQRVCRMCQNLSLGRYRARKRLGKGTLVYGNG